MVKPDNSAGRQKSKIRTVVVVCGGATVLTLCVFFAVVVTLCESEVFCAFVVHFSSVATIILFLGLPLFCQNEASVIGILETAKKSFRDKKLSRTAA